MKKSILIATLVLASSGPSFAQQSNSQPSSSDTSTIIRTPQSSNGGSTGMSGSVGSPTPMYPSRLRDYNDPAASYGRFGSPYTGGVRPNRR
jgi:hypothetical protein